MPMRAPITDQAIRPDPMRRQVRANAFGPPRIRSGAAVTIAVVKKNPPRSWDMAIPRTAAAPAAATPATPQAHCWPDTFWDSSMTPPRS